MVCKNIRKYLLDYKMGQLDPDMHKLIEQHLEECKECRKALEEEESVSNFLKSLEDPLVPVDDIAEEVLEKVTEEEEKEKIKPMHFSRMSLKSKLIFFTVVFVFFVVIALLVIPERSNQQHYFTTYGGAGYTWIDDGNEEITDTIFRNEEELYSSGSMGLGGIAAMAGVDIVEENEKEEENNRITHTFEFDSNSEKNGKE